MSEATSFLKFWDEQFSPGLPGSIRAALPPQSSDRARTESAIMLNPSFDKKVLRERIDCLSLREIRRQNLPHISSFIIRSSHNAYLS